MKQLFKDFIDTLFLLCGYVNWDVYKDVVDSLSISETFLADANKKIAVYEAQQKNIESRMRNVLGLDAAIVSIMSISHEKKVLCSCNEYEISTCSCGCEMLQVEMKVPFTEALKIILESVAEVDALQVQGKKIVVRKRKEVMDNVICASLATKINSYLE